MLERILLGFSVLLLAACNNYDLTVNDRVVYTPKPLFSGYQIADQALQACVEQAILDNKITSATGLQTLNCSNAGITELSGIAVFSALEQLNLSTNEITNLTPLRALSALETLYLDSNAILDAAPLYTLTNLQELDLAKNRSLQCPASSVFASIDRLKLPRHCRK